MSKRKNAGLFKPIITLLVIAVIGSYTAKRTGLIDTPTATPETGTVENVQGVNSIKDAIYTGEDYVVVNNNEPFFTDSQIVKVGYEKYSDLDSLGRCGVAMACLGTETMPTEKRGNISSIKPTGWVQNKYNFIDGQALYNRSHLIGYQLSGENANPKNLITGTRYFNAHSMVTFENEVAEYIKETSNHVMYRVTPYFEGDNLVANGVEMEAYSVEDNGEGVKYNVFVFNVQPGVAIDYTTGDNHAE